MTDNTSNTDGENETVTLTVEVGLDELHADALDDVCAVLPDRETALDQLSDQLSAQLAENGTVEAMIYQARQQAVRQQQQAAQQFADMPAETGEAADGHAESD